MRTLAGILAAILFSLFMAGPAAANEDVSQFLWSHGKGTGGDYENGLKAARAGDWRLSAHFLNRHVGRDPQDADALTYLGMSHSRLGEFEKALRYFDAALSIDPDHRLALSQMGTTYLSANQPAKAKEQSQALRRLCPGGCPELKALDHAMQGFKMKGPGS